MNRLFLDANILLDFYRFGTDDISEIHKIIKLIEDKEIELYTNKQLKDEIDRNREKIVSETLQTVKNNKFSARTPNFGKDLAEHFDLNDKLKLANEANAKLTAILNEMISKKQLPADKLILGLFEKSKSIKITPEIMERARTRVDLGNPPGKKNSLGDSVHWESILAVKNLLSIDIVSKDGDFSSELSPEVMKDFLQQEWKAKKGFVFAEVKLFKSLSEFFSVRFPQIRLSEEAKKDELISQLAQSTNFATTHSVIEKLSNFKFFTQGQVIRLFQILVENNQVGWIGTDQDVKEFYLSLEPKALWVPDEYQEQAAKYLEIDANDFFFPF